MPALWLIPVSYTHLDVYKRQQVSLAPLLPKLRGHFAEFLDNASSAGLRILSSSTCVGLRLSLIHI